LVVAWSLLALSLWVESAALHTAWRQRTSQVAGLPALVREAGWRRLLRRFPDPLERLSRPLLQTTWGRRLVDEWLDAGLGKRPSRYLVLLLLAALGGGLLGARIGGPVLGMALGGAGPSWQSVARRARRERAFGEQLHHALASWRAAWQPVLVQQAVEYTAAETPAPVSATLKRLAGG
jgi:Flp pilus assembly protein TadB